MKTYIIGFVALCGVAIVIWLLLTPAHPSSSNNSNSPAPASGGGAYNLH